MFASAASAQVEVQKPGQAKVRIERFGEAELQSAARSANALSTLDAKSRSKVKDHLDEAARNGRLVDESQMKVAELADPHSPGEKITLTWDSPKAPNELLYSQRESATGARNMAIGLQMGGGDATGMPTEKKRDPQAGSGYAAVFGIDNMYRQDNGCSTGWFRPMYPSDYDHKMVSCYEVFGLDKTPIFVYNRWALWTPAATGPYERAWTVDMEVSSRPWKGKESLIKQLADWAPRSGDTVKKCDTNQNFTIGGGWGGLNGSVTMPINVCQEYWLNISAGAGTQNRMTIDFDGSRDGQMYMDISGKYDAKDQFVLPIWADRNYVQLNWCDAALFCFKEYWAKADSGW